MKLNAFVSVRDVSYQHNEVEAVYMQYYHHNALLYIGSDKEQVACFDQCIITIQWHSQDYTKGGSEFSRSLLSKQIH